MYSEILPDETKETTSAFMRNAIAAFADPGPSIGRGPQALTNPWLVLAQVFPEQGAVFDGGLPVERAASVGEFQEQ